MTPPLRTALLFCFLIAASATAASAQQQPVPGDTLRLSLGEAIDRSLEVSPEVGVNRAQRQFAEARRDEARASRFLTEFQLNTAHAVAPGLTGIDPEVPPEAYYLDPDVENDWSNPRPFNRFAIEAVQPLLTWGELGGNIRAARHGVDVEAAEMRGTELDVAFRTGELYYNVLLTDALARLSEEAEETLDQARAEVERMLEEGDPSFSEADLFQVQLTEQELRRQIAEVTERSATARTALRRQLFLPEGTMALPQEETLQPISFDLEPLETYITLALANRPELAQARAGRAAREALVDVAQSRYYPQLFLGIESAISFAPGRHRQRSAYVSDPFRGRSLRAGFGLRQNLNFLQTRARVDQAQAELNEVRYQQEAAEQLIQFEVEEAYRTLRIRETAMESRREALRISGEWLRTEQINFDLDLGEPENLIDAVQTNLELQAAHFEAVQQYNVAVLRLLRVTGVLNAPEKIGTLVDL